MRKLKKMAANAQTIMKNAASWPPLVYFGLGLVCLFFWGVGTAIQVQTSEAWIMAVPATLYPAISTFQQIGDFAQGKLKADMIVPFTFGWGTQFALIMASVGDRK